MAITLRAQSSSDLLINYVAKEISVLEPALEFAKYGVRQDVPTGFDQLVFPQYNQVTTASVASVSESVNPSATTWGTSSYKVGISQYGVLVQTSDVLMRNSAIPIIQGAVRKVRDAVAREIDVVVQNVVNAGTNGVLYAGGKASRAALGAGDLLDPNTYVKGIRNLRTSNTAGLKPFPGGLYAVLMYPSVEYDLGANANSGGPLDVNRFVSPQDIINGKVQSYRGGVVSLSANVQSFSSTVTVWPTTILGMESFGWGFFQPVTPYLITTPDHTNPLSLYASIGAKFGIGVTRFEDTSTAYRIVRMESAASS